MNLDFHNKSYPPNFGDTGLNGLKYNIPKSCPHCHFANQPIKNSHVLSKYDGGYLQLFSWKCTQCSEDYVTGHTRKDTNDKSSQFLFIYPTLQPKEFSDFINNLSPRFVDIYKEANWSEQNGNLTVAGMGYRLALEILVKDYAIKEKEIPEDEASKKSLFNAIEDYLPHAEHIIAADVVRLKGNDYAHYKEKLESVEFSEMKFYLDTLIDLINVQLKLKYPPVRRQ